MSRWHGASVALYLATWVIVAGLGAQIAPLGSVWWVFPLTIRIAVAVIFGGGQLLAGVFREEQLIVHPERRPPRIPKRRVDEAELRAGQEYDALWQLEDRKRNRERKFAGTRAGLVDQDDLKIDIYTSRGPNGENNRAVRVTHIPSGIAAVSTGKATTEDDVEAARAEIEAKLEPPESDAPTS